ncbi:MAG TPA: ATP-binding protein [Bryobacteraceae bacterium]|jgi:PAS domain S-box-containing protein|nr:ATP-binding protein [Bryobacteraceae bacterium]
MDKLPEGFATILDRMPVACILLDQSLHCTYWNHAAEELFDYYSAEALGRRLFDLIALGEESSPEDEFRRCISARESQVSRVTGNRSKQGRVLACEWSTTRLAGAGGELLGLLCVCRDLTEQRQLQEQLRQAQKAEAMGLLVGGISHDFNNLLTVISGYSGMLIRDAEPGSAVFHHAEQVADAVDRASSLTRQLLAFSRKRVVQPALLDLNDLVSKMEKLLRRVLGEDVELITTLAHDLGAVRIDRGQVEQVLMNLAVNARWAMPEGGRLRIQTSRADLDHEHRYGRFSCPPGRYVLLSVTDTGHGMDHRTRERIFEPFFTTRDFGEGTGLGLATVRRIVEENKGHILVFSERGSGTSMKLYLPRVEEWPYTVERRDNVSVEEGSQVGTILLVEDEALVLETVKRMLAREGYTVLEAKTQEQACETCRSYPGVIDLLLTDVVLREGSGPDLAAEAVLLRPDLIVVYMTGYSDHGLLRNAIRDSAAFLIQKPLTTRSLNSILRRAMRPGRQMTARPIS